MLPDNPILNNYRGKKMTIGEALVFLRAGHALCRHGWNGKDMFIYHVPADAYQAKTDVAKKYFGETVPYGEYLAMKTAQNNVVPWLASQTDILADDWYLVE